MSTTPAPMGPLSSQVYRALLVFFPPRFRAEYECEMVLFFGASLRAAHHRGGLFNVLFVWLVAIIDLGQAAVHEWLVSRPGPGHYAQQLGLGLAAGVAGGLVAGLGARLAMRGVALAGGLPPGFTLLGTLAIVLAGVIGGMPFGVGFMPLRSLLPGSGVWKGVNYGLLLFLVFMAPPLLVYREGEAGLASPLVGLALFAPLGLAYGGTVALVVQRLERRLHGRAAAEARPAFQWPTLARQILAILVFALLLELGVLGAISISNHIQSIPTGILRAGRAVSLPYTFLRDGNQWLINLTTLGYFGLASLLFWGRRRSPMARFTALALFAFGAGLFNTGASYYAGLFTDLAPVRAAFHALQVLGVSALLALLYLFPHGRLAAAWARPLALAWPAFALLWLLAPLPDPLTFTVIVAFFVSGVVAQVQRYRAAAPAERPQLRWPLVGFAVAILGFSLVALAVLIVPGLKLPRVEGLSVTATFGLYMLPWLFIPTTIGYAMRRHRLWAT